MSKMPTLTFRNCFQIKILERWKNDYPLDSFIFWVIRGERREVCVYEKEREVGREEVREEDISSSVSQTWQMEDGLETLSLENLELPVFGMT